MLQQERVTVLQNQSEQTKLGQLIISVRGRTGDEIEFVVGCPGLPNVHKEFFRVGDSVLFETPDDGIIDVRVMAVGATIGARFLISQVSPCTGIAGGFVDQDPATLHLHLASSSKSPAALHRCVRKSAYGRT